ncbi:unnamed protein product [Calicophoron daubneyi]|uniref:Uncharacterized protein n=1 Tax=Calicophoron daubneyi TaxID=300641 RepID=A0AAV2TA83_CALDB
MVYEVLQEQTDTEAGRTYKVQSTAESDDDETLLVGGGDKIPRFAERTAAEKNSSNDIFCDNMIRIGPQKFHDENFEGGISVQITGIPPRMVGRRRSLGWGEVETRKCRKSSVNSNESRVFHEERTVDPEFFRKYTRSAELSRTRPSIRHSSSVKSDLLAGPVVHPVGCLHYGAPYIIHSRTCNQGQDETLEDEVHRRHSRWSVTSRWLPDTNNWITQFSTTSHFRPRRGSSRSNPAENRFRGSDIFSGLDFNHLTHRSGSNTSSSKTFQGGHVHETTKNCEDIVSGSEVTSDTIRTGQSGKERKTTKKTRGNVVGITTHYCASCSSDRIHVEGVCSQCKQRNCRTQPKGPDKGVESTASKTNKTELFSSAAKGLIEFAQDSSDEEPQAQVPSDVKRNNEDQAEAGSSENQAQLLAVSGVKSSPAGSEAGSVESNHTYVMENSTEMAERFAQLERKSSALTPNDSPYSLSNSGSFHGEADKRNDSGTYSRPRLPASLMRGQNQAQGSRPGRILEVHSSSSQSDCKHAAAGCDSDYLLDTQKLVAQLEMRMMKSEKGQKKSGFEGYSPEDKEVANALLNSENSHVPGVNLRLLAMIQKRNSTRNSAAPNRNSAPPEDNKATDGSRRQLVHMSRDNRTPSAGRTQSQQPLVRNKNGMESVRRESSLVTSRVGAQPKGCKYGYADDKSEGSSRPRGNDFSGIKNQSKLCSSLSPRGPVTNPLETAKINAQLNWQRRKAYEPKIPVGRNQSRSGVHSTTQSFREEESPSSSTDNTSAVGQHKLGGRNTARPARRTAPVETADCLAALESIRSERAHPSHCSVVPKLLVNSHQKIVDTNRRPTNDRMTRSITEQTCQTNGVSSSSSAEEDKLGKKKRTVRARSVNNEDVPNEIKPRRSTAREAISTSKSNQQGADLPLIGSARLHCAHNGRSNIQVRSVSQSGHRETGVVTGKVGRVKANHSEAQETWNGLPKSKNYPDMGVESIRYKIEKLTNFIVRLRKRIERDYAEQGTCSPGDDVFGDEAVGATVAGRPTGMHPVVAASLKNLRILEFNAQEIFSLLYPTEVDLWEPARNCLAGGIGDERTYNEAQSKITEHLSDSIQRMEQEQTQSFPSSVHINGGDTKPSSTNLPNNNPLYNEHTSTPKNEDDII